MNCHPSILREYDIRGIIGETLFEEDAYSIGRYFGQIVREQGGKAIAVARDGRLSSPTLAARLIQGLYETGLKVYDLGQGPTPFLYFSEYALPVDAAIMVTGSHNPPDYNGFKLTLQKHPFFGDDIRHLPQRILKEAQEGGQIDKENLIKEYAQNLLQRFTFGKDLKIAWDLSNSVVALVVAEIIKTLPGEHILLNAEVDGHFPGHFPDPTDPANLQQLQACVIENKCDLGIAFDGDGDRLVGLDEKGRRMEGDQLLLLFARDLLTRVPDAIVIADIKTSQVMLDEIPTAILWRTGHSHIKGKMAETGALLGGEVSGHYFFKEDYYGFDDGIYAALKLIQLVSYAHQSLATMHDALPTCPSTPEIRIPCSEDLKFSIPDRIKQRLRAQGYSLIDIDGIRVQIGKGWWLLRPSNTQDLLIARCEAPTPAELEVVQAHLKAELVREGITL